MKKAKQSLCLVLVLILVLMMAGCGGMAGSTAAPASVAAGDYDTAPATAAGEDAYSYVPSESVAHQGEDWRNAPKESAEAYDDSEETPFKKVETSPLSTFSADVDTASYSNMRRFLNMGNLPQGVRIEELVNYFSYEYVRPAQTAEHPFSVTAEVEPCPWNQDHVLAMIGVQAAQLEERDMANNIVFLLDVSGSMEADNKLPLLRESFKLLIEQLGEDDVISIVTYAGSDKVVADSIRGSEQNKLVRLMDGLSAGGSTAGAAGLKTAYQLAEKNFIEGGNNRIILATDGDFNVGQQTTADLKDMIETERERGVFISVLGFGMGNLKDDMMETIADCGNGNYAYIDTLSEAKKVLVDEFDSTMFVVAKDLKLQVEFNGAVVQEYRLIGYNNRRLENEDFEDDKKDAGDVGAGHSVTAFYELVPADGEGKSGDLIYQTVTPTGSSDYMTVKVRYKQPDGDESILAEFPVTASAFGSRPSRDFQFASAVAEFGLILTDSNYRGTSSAKSVIERAQENLGRDPYGLRQEFCELVDIYRDIAD